MGKIPRLPGTEEVDRLFRVNEAADLLAMKPWTLRKWISMRKIAVVKIGRSVRIPKSEIYRLIEEGYRPRSPIYGQEWWAKRRRVP